MVLRLWLLVLSVNTCRSMPRAQGMSSILKLFQAYDQHLFGISQKGDVIMRGGLGIVGTILVILLILWILNII